MIDNTSDKFRHSLLANIGRRLTHNAFNDGFALYEYCDRTVWSYQTFQHKVYTIFLITNTN
jgi:hypothetical protein